MQGGGLLSSCVAWVGSRWKEETHPGSHAQARGWVSENNSHPGLQSHARGWAFVILYGAMHVISKTLKTKHTLPIVTDDDGHDVVVEEKKACERVIRKTQNSSNYGIWYQ